MDSRGKRLVRLLMRTGMPRNLARILVFLAAKGETTSMEIEKSTGLRQPEVSISMRELRGRGWVTKRDVKKEGKGRPLHAYRLTRPFMKIVEEIVEAERKKIRSIEEAVRLLQREAKAFSSP
ncbi:MAG: MarR family transcriptional regulator [Thermoplasmata archaeon]